MKLTVAIMRNRALKWLFMEAMMKLIALSKVQNSRRGDFALSLAGTLLMSIKRSSIST
jgi:hypothetical protein